MSKRIYKNIIEICLIALRGEGHLDQKYVKEITQLLDKRIKEGIQPKDFIPIMSSKPIIKNKMDGVDLS